MFRRLTFLVMALGLCASVHADEAASPGSVQTVEAFFEAYDEADTDRLSTLIAEDAEMFVQSSDGFMFYRKGRADVLAYLADVFPGEPADTRRVLIPAGHVVVVSRKTDFLAPEHQSHGERRLVQIKLEEQKVSVLLNILLDRGDPAYFSKWIRP
ncbi:nuclear transport factor 2 family protein [Ponticaulis profundi]|uniref:Nuclear transport factor 2 family protein n=1 Tax=Ponticaulis profundi TaxID=2665222 RepID=A0ABW1SBU2_9PROT